MFSVILFGGAILFSTYRFFCGNNLFIIDKIKSYQNSERINKLNSIVKKINKETCIECGSNILSIFKINNKSECFADTVSEATRRIRIREKYIIVDKIKYSAITVRLLRNDPIEQKRDDIKILLAYDFKLTDGDRSMINLDIFNNIPIDVKNNVMLLFRMDLLDEVKLSVLDYLVSMLRTQYDPLL